MVTWVILSTVISFNVTNESILVCVDRMRLHFFLILIFYLKKSIAMSPPIILHLGYTSRYMPHVLSLYTGSWITVV